ncbi:MAG TPA: hypothetical protein VE224_01530 [Pseudolabrys sp.]|nr:hypothetical protein [Pseudolabrys sp.]
MSETIGIVLLLLMVGMIIIARPRAGQDRAPFLGTWAMTQAYILVMLTFFLAGAGLLIRSFIA